jgi:acylglycerol lipase
MASRTDNVDGSSQTLKIGGIDCCIHAWNIDNSKAKQPRAVVVIYHGFLAHGKYPTVRYAAELLAAHSYVVVAADMPGHGKSQGTRGYLPGAISAIQYGLAIAEYATKIFDSEAVAVPIFLVGSSMGGTIALSVANELGNKVTGVVLLAPMLAINVGEPARYLLKALSSLVPTLKVIPSSSTSSEKQYRDPVKRKECEDDNLSIPGSTI